MKLWFMNLLNSYSSTARKTRHPLLEAALHGADKRAWETRQRVNLATCLLAACGRLVTMSSGLVADALSFFAHTQWACAITLGFGLALLNSNKCPTGHVNCA